MYVYCCGKWKVHKLLVLFTSKIDSITLLIKFTTD